MVLIQQRDEPPLTKATGLAVVFNASNTGAERLQTAVL
jgi:hypothetical protein